MTKISCIIHESEDIYHSRSRSGEMMSSHLLSLFGRSPYKYHQTVSGLVEQEDKPEYVFGRAAHKLILEGQAAFDEAYTVADGPINPKTNMPYGKATQAYQNWLADQHGEVISTADYETIKAMHDNCWSHNEIAELLNAEDGEAEGVVRAHLEDVPCQIRMDFFASSVGIVDLKTCRDIEFFEKDCRDFGYAYQLAFYQSVLQAACGVKFPVHFIVVDKTDFHIAGRWDIPDIELEQCDSINRAALRRYKESLANEKWPTGYEHTRLFALHKEC